MKLCQYGHELTLRNDRGRVNNRCLTCNNLERQAARRGLGPLYGPKWTAQSKACLQCGASTKNPKFCTQSCSAKYNNSINPKRQLQGKCSSCGVLISGSRTYCGGCYNDPAIPTRSVQDPFDRFSESIDFGESTGDCWVWQGALNLDRYGRFMLNGKYVAAHRFSYLSFVGPIPEDKPCILHDCDNPPCVNPLHLHPGTHKQNMEEMVARGRHRGFEKSI